MARLCEVGFAGMARREEAWEKAGDEWFYGRKTSTDYAHINFDDGPEGCACVITWDIVSDK